jgi:hypothetical protein
MDIVQNCDSYIHKPTDLMYSGLLHITDVLIITKGSPFRLYMQL